MEQKNDIWEAFKAAAREKAELQTLLISKRGDRNAAVHKFHEAFGYVHALVLHNSKFRDYEHEATTLASAIAAWLEQDEITFSDSAEGFALFDEFNLALGRLGLI